MAQGKNKVKAKLPANVKHKSLNKTKNTAFQKRKSEKFTVYLKFTSLSSCLLIDYFLDAPAKQKLKDKQKIQEAITKSVNRKNEDEIRSRAVNSGQQVLSNAQKSVAKYHESRAGTSIAEDN